MAAQRFWNWVNSLSNHTDLSGTEELYINDAGISKKTTIAAVNALVSSGAGYAAKTATVTPVTTTASPADTASTTVYSNEGDTDGATVTLPTAAAGLQFTFIVDAAQTFTITAGAGDTIRLTSNVTAAAGSITSAVIGSAVTLVAINSVEWIGTSITGSWSI
jgi:hypothetical protein